MHRRIDISAAIGVKINAVFAIVPFSSGVVKCRFL